MAKLIFDIETYADVERLSLLPEPKAPRNLKDPDKIASAIEEAIKERNEKAALDPDVSVLCTLGMAFEDGDVNVYINQGLIREPIRLPDDNTLMVSEGEMLEKFWKAVSMVRGNIAGYNILNFDLPFILRRSFALGVKPSWFPEMARFRNAPTTDLMQILYNWGAMPYKSLKVVADLYLGIEYDVSGADIGGLVEAGEWDKIIAYQRKDVVVTRTLYRAMKGYYFAEAI